MVNVNRIQVSTENVKIGCSKKVEPAGDLDSSIRYRDLLFLFLSYLLFGDKIRG